MPWGRGGESGGVDTGGIDWCIKQRCKPDFISTLEYPKTLQAASMSREGNCHIFYLHDQNAQKQTGSEAW